MCSVEDLPWRGAKKGPPDFIHSSAIPFHEIFIHQLLCVCPCGKCHLAQTKPTPDQPAPRAKWQARFREVCGVPAC